MDEFELVILKRFQDKGRVDFPIGDSSLIKRYSGIIDNLHSNGYIDINSRNNEYVKADITDVGISILDGR